MHTLKLMAAGATLMGLLALGGWRQAIASDDQPAVAQILPGVTDIDIGQEVLRTGVKRLGINLSGQSFYDSGQMLRNLTFRNPGFEGGTWQSILHCKWVTANSCTDENQYTVWPAGFMAGATFSVMSGTAKGSSGSVASSSAAGGGRGVTIAFHDGPRGLAAGDFVLVRVDKPGNAQAGWWTGTSGGATLTTELHDLAPGTDGRQALRIEAAHAGQSANVISWFDTFGRSFVQLRGGYTLRFRARGLAGKRIVSLKLERLDQKHGLREYLNKDVVLDPEWKDYSYRIVAAEDGSAEGPVGLTFAFAESSALLDDVSLTEDASANNPTPFRNAVVDALRTLRPGVLRYMDNGGDFGSSLDNMLTPAFGRQRTGSSTQEVLHEDIAIGLHEFLVLCKAVGAEPWYSMPPGSSPAEAAALAEYLGGDASTPYGAKRAALGQTLPWTKVFPVIHLELGNEQWNQGSFAGSTINDPTAYAKRISDVFAALRGAASFHASSYDLIMGSWAAVPWWTQQQLSSARGLDTVAVAPYLFSEFNDGGSLEAIFGPMLAEPQMVDSASGLMGQQLAAMKGHGLAVYEVNLGTDAGSATQAQVDLAVPSFGAGLAVVDHMLLMLRDLGVTTQCLFGLPQYVNNYYAADGTRRTMPLWGAVVDMGGATNLRRPQFLAEELANAAILPTMLRTRVSSPEPTWDQAKSTNAKVELQGVKLLQTFAFSDGQKHSLVLLNLSRTEAIPVTFSGANRPSGVVEQQQLNATAITDNNEQAEKIRVDQRNVEIVPSSAYSLPAHSMTVLTW